MPRDAREIRHEVKEESDQGSKKKRGANTKKGQGEEEIDGARESKRGSGRDSRVISIAVNSSELTASSNSIRIATGGGPCKFRLVLGTRAADGNAGK